MKRRSVPCPLVLATALCLAACTGGGGGGGADAMTPDVRDPEGGSGGGARSDAGAAGDGAGAGTGAGVGPAGTGGGESGRGGADEDGGTPFTPVPLAELPEAFAGAICDALASCLGEAALRELTAREDCLPRITAELRATEFHHMDRAIATGHVLYDPSELSACLEGVRELGCDVLTDSYPEPCVRVLAGNVAAGGECAVSAECQGTAFCAGAASGQCPSTCTELLGEGETCAGHNECGDGMLCLGGFCSVLASEGEPCAGDSGARCRFGLSCLGATDTEAGECTPNAEVQVGDEGDVCEPGGLLCKDGLSCVFDGIAGFHCQPYVGAGEGCRLGLPGQCPRDQYCDAPSVTEDGTCRDLPSDGQPCVLTGLCAPGHACVPEGQDAVCRAIQDNGGPCGADAACRSGSCVGGMCEPPPVCD